MCAVNQVKTRFTFLRQDFDLRWGNNFKTTQKTTLAIISSVQVLAGLTAVVQGHWR